MKSFNVIVPLLGSVPESYKINSWKLKKGDPVSKGDVLCELETSQAVVELESKHSGVLQAILFDEGESVLPGNNVALVVKEEAEKKTEKAPEKEPEKAPEKVPEKEPEKEPEKVEEPEPEEEEGADEAASDQEEQEEKEAN